MSGGRRNSSWPVAESVLERARSGEPDRYLSALLAPAQCQSDLVVLAAFVADVAAIPSAVSEPLIGEMRLQWWRDALNKDGGSATSGHPIADALAEVVDRHRLPAEALLRFVDARSHDLTGELHADERALERYLADTEGVPFALAAIAAGGGAWPLDLAEDAGIAYGLARMLGRLPALLHNGGFPLPASSLAEAGIDATSLASRPYAEATKAAVEQLALHFELTAQKAMSRARVKLRGMAAVDRLAALPLAMVEPYFKAQKTKGFVRLEMLADVSPLRRIWQLAKAHYVNGI